MKICKVVGKVWATRKDKSLFAKKLLLVRPVDAMTGKLKGDIVMAVDLVGAGEGDTVLVNDEGNSARMMIENPVAGVRTVVCGIVDEVNIEKSKKVT